MRVGYERVSSKSQNLDRQTHILEKDNCRKIFKDKISGATTNRPGLHKMLNFVHDGDIVEVVAMDRLGRNKNDDLAIMREIKAKDAVVDIANFTMMTAPTRKPNEDDNHFKQRVNTYSFINTIMINAVAYVAETERREIKERQRQGIESAKRRGVYKGAKLRYGRDNRDLQEAFDDYFNRDRNHFSVAQIARLHGLSRSTLYKKLRKYKPRHYEEQFSLKKS